MPKPATVFFAIWRDKGAIHVDIFGCIIYGGCEVYNYCGSGGVGEGGGGG